MNYPLLSEYIEAIKSAEDNFNELSNLRPVLDDDGQPVMSGGNFAVVFKMRDEQTGKFHAVKCFLKEQEGRAEAYRLIAEELEFVNSTYLTPIKYLERELFVDTNNSDETEFPVLLMDWVEGDTLDKYIREHIDNQYDLSMLAYQFSRLAMWLIPQPFAHGDLKPDNIIVKDDGALVLVDYDGMYVPTMKGRKAREMGSPDFRHPARTENDFNERIDDFALISILLSLKAISLQPDLMEQYAAVDRLLFSERDYRELSKCVLLHELFPADDTDVNKLYSLFILCLVETFLPISFITLCSLNRPSNKSKHNIPYLLKRANHGDSNSQYILGTCYMYGDDVEKDYDEATKWLTKAANSNHAKALRDLGYCYIYGKGVEKNVEKALALFDQAELYYVKEDFCALMEYRVIALEELGLFNDCISIINEYVKLGAGCKKCSYVYKYDQINRSCPWMQYKIGYYYYYGKGVEKNYSKAVEWFAKSAEQGNTEGQRRLGFCYHLGYGVKKDYSKAVEWYKKSASQGNAEGQWLLGYCYKYGHGVDKDDSKAVEWYAKSAEQGSAEGQWRLGDCYEYGRGVEKDDSKAVEWFAKSAKQGNAVGQWLLGNCYKYGHGVDKDYSKAIEWFAKSAEQGNSDAQWLLGNCYKYGHGVDKDYSKAVEWFAKSAEQGNSDAQWQLGYCYENGHGVKRDFLKAVEWYKKSAGQGNNNAQQGLKRILTTLQ